MKVFHLDLASFPSGKEYFRQGKFHESAMVVHANYMKGQEIKKQKLEEVQMWKSFPPMDAPDKPDLVQ